MWRLLTAYDKLAEVRNEFIPRPLPDRLFGTVHV
jgi:hypothetical protein